MCEYMDNTDNPARHARVSKNINKVSKPETNLEMDAASRDNPETFEPPETTLFEDVRGAVFSESTQRHVRNKELRRVHAMIN